MSNINCSVYLRLSIKKITQYRTYLTTTCAMYFVNCMNETNYHHSCTILYSSDNFRFIGRKMTKDRASVCPRRLVHFYTLTYLYENGQDFTDTLIYMSGSFKKWVWAVVEGRRGAWSATMPRKLIFWSTQSSALSSINHTVCPESSDPFYIVTYYVKWVSTSWTYCKRINKIKLLTGMKQLTNNWR